MQLFVFKIDLYEIILMNLDYIVDWPTMPLNDVIKNLDFLFYDQLTNVQISIFKVLPYVLNI